MTKIYRYEVPVDDKWHTIELHGFIGMVGCRDPRVVEFWASHDENENPVSADFIVIGTGHPWPENAYWVDTVIAPGGQLVWHLLRKWDN